MAIVIGDKTKNEKVRLFVHAPLGGEHTPDLSAIQKTASVEDIIKNPNSTEFGALQTYFSGHGNLNPDAMKKLLDRLGVDEIYFGHADPYGFIKKGTQDPKTRKAPAERDADGNFVLESNINKLDNIKSPIGALAGGANFIDSQSKNATSGYMVIDLDKDSKQTKLMPDLIKDANNDPAIQKVVHAATNTSNKKASTKARASGIAARIMEDIMETSAY
jgi:hypothetical protein